MMSGYLSKVYITGFDGEGINGPSPVSLDARQPMFSRDGESLIFNVSIGDHSGVFVTDDKGQAPKLIIGRDSAYWPVFSPDGSEVMYAEMSLDYKIHRLNSIREASELQANGRPILGRNVLWSDDNRLVFQGCATWLGQEGECGTEASQRADCYCR